MLFQLDHVTKNYKGIRALDDLVASVEPGAIGLLGPNGAGKSTLIKALLGLVQITRGNATILGHDVRRSKHRIREIVGYMPEDDCLVHGLKGVETVAYAAELGGLPRRVALRRSHEILDYVGLAEERYREVQTFSSGMKQRIKLALSLVHSPQVVFLDEPTSGLDPEGRDRMMQLIRDLNRKRGISVVISTHILSDIEASCDHVLILGAGKILMQDSLASLQQHTGTFRIRWERSGDQGNPDPAAFARSLDAAGLNVVPDTDTAGGDARTLAGRCLLKGCGNDLPREVFRLAVEHGVSIRLIEPDRTTLEEIFLSAVDAQPVSGSGASPETGPGDVVAPKTVSTNGEVARADS